MRRGQLPTETVSMAEGIVEFRLEPGEGLPIVVFPGAHMSAGVALGEPDLRRAGSPVLVISRPGYGQTDVGPIGPQAFAAVTERLCQHLGFPHLAAVVGVSAGGQSAVWFAAQFPERVNGLILQSAAPGATRWPDGRGQRAVAPRLFGPRTGPVVWSAMRLLVTRFPRFAMTAIASPLTTLPAKECVATFTPAERIAIGELYCQMDSGTGFHNDLRHFAALDPADAVGAMRSIRCPTLVMASRQDGSVGWQHTLEFATSIPDAELYESSAPWHLLWFGSDRDGVSAATDTFLRRLIHPPEPIDGA